MRTAGVRIRNGTASAVQTELSSKTQCTQPLVNNYCILWNTLHCSVFYMPRVVSQGCNHLSQPAHNHWSSRKVPEGCEPRRGGYLINTDAPPGPHHSTACQSRVEHEVGCSTACGISFNGTEWLGPRTARFSGLLSCQHHSAGTHVPAPQLESFPLYPLFLLRAIKRNMPCSSPATLVSIPSFSGSSPTIHDQPQASSAFVYSSQISLDDKKFPWARHRKISTMSPSLKF